MQRELLRAYESGQLNGVSIRTVKRLMDQRRFAGKRRDANPGGRKTRTSAESLINTFKRESQRQKLLVKKARVCEAKLLFIVTAFNKLLADENFVTLLRAEALAEMPRYMHDKLTERKREAA
jgi:ParB family chromosome partitioning protein